MIARPGDELDPAHVKRTPYKWGATDYWMVVAYCAMVVFGWWVPNDLIERSPELRAFCDFMAAVIPQIDRVTTLGGVTIGNAQRVIYSVLWVFAIFTLPVAIWRRFKEVQRDGFEPEHRTTSWLMVVFAPTLGSALALNALFLYSMDLSSRLGSFVFANRFGAGIFAPLLVFVPVAVIFGIFLLVWGVLTRRVVIGDEK